MLSEKEVRWSVELASREWLMVSTGLSRKLPEEVCVRCPLLCTYPHLSVREQLGIP